MDQPPLAVLGFEMLDLALLLSFTFLYIRDTQFIIQSAALICTLYFQHLNEANAQLRLVSRKYRKKPFLIPYDLLGYFKWFHVEHTKFTVMVSLNNSDLVRHIISGNIIVQIPISGILLYIALYNTVTQSEQLAAFTLWAVCLLTVIVSSYPVAKANKAFYGAKGYIPTIQRMLKRDNLHLKLKYDNLHSRLTEGEVNIGFYIGTVKVVSFATLWEV